MYIFQFLKEYSILCSKTNIKIENEFWKENLLKYSEEILIRPFASEVINKLKL